MATQNFVITAIFSLFILLYIIGLASILEQNAFKVMQYLRSKYKIEVFLMKTNQ